MYLSRHQTSTGPCWAADGKLLPPNLSLSILLELPATSLTPVIQHSVTDIDAPAEGLAPIDAKQEVWASGVTYLRSRVAREEESESSADAYAKVYDADRPELFAKAAGWRVVGNGDAIRIRRDSAWNVPEPEVTLVINRLGEIVGYCAGNDVSSRDIEGENPLYLPQAKVYNGSCALGPGIQLATADTLRDVPIQVTIVRDESVVFHGKTSSAQMKRQFEELAAYLVRELDFPHGVFLMTGTGIVPDDDFTLQVGDSVSISVGDLTLENDVTS